MPKIKISVVKKMSNPDLTAEYGNNVVLPCDRFELGQEYVLDRGKQPDGFCSWAWADIQRDVTTMLYGANMPWMKKPGTVITCCTDGLRPVVFKIERIEE